MNSCASCGAKLWPEPDKCPVCGATATKDAAEILPSGPQLALPAETESQAEAALALVESGDPAAAVLALQEAARRDGGLLPSEMTAMGLALEALGMPDEGERALYSALRLAPAAREVRLALALAARARGDRATARDHLVTALAISPEDEQIGAELAALRDEFRQADGACRELLWVAHNQAMRGETAAARESAMAAYQYNPENASALRTLIVLNENAGNLEDARHFALRLVEVRPDDMSALAIAERLDARQAVRTSAVARVRDLLGLSHRTGDRTHAHSALAIADSSLALDPDCSELHMLRGIALDVAGYPLAAADAYRLALRHDPSNDEARARLEAIVQAEATTARVMRERPAVEAQERMKRTRMLWRRRGVLTPPRSPDTL